MRKLVGAMALLALACALALPTEAPAQAKGDEVVKQVLDAWAKRRVAMKSVRYKIKGTETYAKGSLTSDLEFVHPIVKRGFPQEDITNEKMYDVVIDLERGRLRTWSRGMILASHLGRFRPYSEHSYFNGKEATVLTPRLENTSELHTPSKTQPDAKTYKTGFREFPYELSALFAACGLPKLKGQSQAAEGWHRQGYQAEQFVYSGNVKHGESSCVVLRTKKDEGSSGGYDEVWIDLARTGAVLRWSLFAADEVVVKVDIQYQQHDGHWLPVSWDCQIMNLRIEKMNVLETVVEPPELEQLVTCTYKPGMIVRPADDFKALVVGADGKTLTPLIPVSNQGQYWRWGGLLLAIVVAVLAITCWYRKQQAAATAGEV